MQLKVIGSGSKGNMYVMTASNGENIIIEAGLRWKKMITAMDFDLSKTKLALCTHGHMDHSSGASELLSNGVELVLSAGTAGLKHIQGHDYNKLIIKHGQRIKRGDFEIMAFNVKHDCPGGEPLGFLIRHPESGLTLFLTDTYILPHRVDGLNNIMIEANYCESIMAERYDRGSLKQYLKDRICVNHLSLDTCKGILRANDLSKVNNILLIHLSDANSHAERFKSEIYQQTLKTVNVAEPGLTLNWNLTPWG